MTSLTVWSNAGGIYNDGELRTFDLEVDYLDVSGTAATLIMPGVDIGDTVSINDPKSVIFIDGGSPVELVGVTEVRISNLGGSAGEHAWREIFAETVTRDNDLTTVKTVTPSTEFPAVGDTVTFEIIVTNDGADEATAITLVDFLPFGLTGTGSNGTVTGGSYNFGDGTWLIPSLVAGGSETLTLQGIVDAGQERNLISNSTTAADNLANDELDTTGDILTASTTVADPLLNITKVADITADVNAGDIVTYTDTVTNIGNVNISGVGVSEVHNGSGPVPIPTNPSLSADVAPIGDSTDLSGDNIWTTLAPNDEVVFTGTYTVTQSDVDTLQ